MQASDTSLSPSGKPDPTVDPLVGWRTESLLFESCLGRGAMGAVYRGTQVRLDRQVAIKVISEHLSADQAYVDRFNREARTLAKLAHPNVVTCYDFGPITGPGGRTLLVLVMEFVDGVSLTGFTRAGAAVKTLLDLYRQAAEGLAAAHALGVLHRDVKPDNIMVTQGGVAKLADFGLAKGQEGSVLTMTGTIMGTPAYMAPEICKGGEPLPASDVYSLGCSLFDSLAGMPPFRSGSALEVIQLHITEEPPTLSDYVPQVSQLDGLVRRVLEKDPEGRPPARDLATQLAKWRDLSSPGIKVGPSGLDGQRQRADERTMTNAVDVEIPSAEEVGIPDAQSARSLPGSKPAGRRPSAQMPPPAGLREVDLGLDGAPSPEGARALEVPLPERGAFQVPDYLMPLPTQPAPTASAPPAVPEAVAIPAVTPAPPLAPALRDAPAAAASSPAAAAAPAATLAPSARPQRTASVNDAEKREQLHGEAVSRRIAEAKQSEEQGDAALRARHAVAALRAFEQALKLVTSGPAKANLVAKIQRARALQLQSRLLWGGLAVVVLGVLAAVAWKLMPAAPVSDGPLAAAPVAAKPSAQDPLQAVLTRFHNGTDDPHAVAAQLQLLLPSLDQHDPRLSELQGKLSAQIKEVDDQLASVVGIEHSDPVQALSRSEVLRKQYNYAPWFLRQLPLPGRLVVRGANLPLVTISDGGVTRRASDGLVFCRSATTTISVVVSGTGYQPVTQEVLPDPATAEQVYPIDMQDRPEWSVAMPGAAWVLTCGQGDDVVELTASGLTIIGPDGAISGKLIPPHLCAEAKTFLQPAGPLSLPVRLCSDDGSCWEIQVADHHVAKSRLVHHGQPILGFCEQRLTYHVNDLGVFAIQLSEDSAFELALSSHDHDLWTRPLGGKIQPHLSQLHETVSTIDEAAITVFDQEGNRLSILTFGALRISPVYELTLPGSALHQLLFLTTTGAHLFQQLDDGWHAIPEPALEGLGQGPLATCGPAIASCVGADVQYLPTAAAGVRWKASLPIDHAVLWIGATADLVLVIDDKSLLSAFSTRDGQLVRSVVIPAPALCPPLVVAGNLIVTTAVATMAYALQGGGGAGATPP